MINAFVLPPSLAPSLSPSSADRDALARGLGLPQGERDTALVRSYGGIGMTPEWGPTRLKTLKKRERSRWGGAGGDEGRTGEGEGERGGRRRKSWCSYRDSHSPPRLAGLKGYSHASSMLFLLPFSSIPPPPLPFTSSPPPGSWRSA